MKITRVIRRLRYYLVHKDIGTPLLVIGLVNVNSLNAANCINEFTFVSSMSLSYFS